MTDPIKIQIRNLSFFYDDFTVLDGISERFRENTISAIVGPSGKGKSTFLMVLNRLWEGMPGARMTGRVEISQKGDFQDIYRAGCSLPELRRLVGMVFQMPNPLPMSVYKNIAFPLKLAGVTNREHIDQRVEKALKRAFLWDEVKDRLQQNAMDLSGGQQQRLCIARALILEPEVLLLDEPTSSLDPRASEVIEALLVELKARCTLLVVSHYQDQVQRIADRVLELSDGRFIQRTTDESKSSHLLSLNCENSK